MLNHCFELHLYWSVESLPEDLVCQRDLLHHVFPERWRERKISQPWNTILHFCTIHSHKWRCFVFLPQDRSVQFCLSLPASLLVPETKHKQAQNLSDRVRMKSSSGAFTVCVAYQWTWRTHSTRSTRFTLKNTKRVSCRFEMRSSNDETTIITFEGHNIRRQIRTLVPTAPDSPLDPRRPACPWWRSKQVSFSCFLQDYVIIYRFLLSFDQVACIDMYQCDLPFVPSVLDDLEVLGILSHPAFTQRIQSAWMDLVMF